MANLAGSIQKAPSGAKGFDTCEVVNPSVAQKVKDDEFTCILTALER